MVEGALIFPIMSFFLVYLELAHHSYDAYLTTEHVAEQRAWSGATVGSMIGNCPKGRDDTSYQPSYFKMMSGGGSGDENTGSNPSTNAGGSSSSASGKLGGNAGPGGWFMHHDTAMAQVTVKRGPVTYDGTQHRPNARSKLFCNQPWVGSLWDIITSL